MKYKVTLNDRVYEVEVEEGTAMLVDEYEVLAPAAVAPAAPVIMTAVTAAAVPAAVAATVAAGEPIESPLPGVVLKIPVSAGQAVKEGDILVVIEAMKMENEVLAPRAGTVAQIVAAKGQTVNTGDTLIILS